MGGHKKRSVYSSCTVRFDQKDYQRQLWYYSTTITNTGHVVDPSCQSVANVTPAPPRPLSQVEEGPSACCQPVLQTEVGENELD